MTLLPYQKWDATGNDFVMVRESRSPLTAEQFSPDLVVRLCDRSSGVGADGVVVLRSGGGPSEPDEMIIWNSDGSPGGMCGNALRCVAMVLGGAGESSEHKVKVGARTVATRVDGPAFSTVMMGPVASQGDRPLYDHLPELDRLLGAPGYLLSFGNPHYVVPTSSIPPDWISRGEQAQALAHQLLGTGGLNCGFLSTETDDEGIYPLCVYERGVGATQSCGSGACAASAVLQHRLGIPPVHRLRLPGGVLTIGRDPTGYELAGGARMDFEGEWEL